jgi:hypothetical protein
MRSPALRLVLQVMIFIFHTLLVPSTQWFQQKQSLIS